MAAKTFQDIMKFNPHHDARGRFASANTATSFTIRTKDPSQQHLADAAAARERERDAAGGGKAEPQSEDDSPRMKTVHGIEDKIRNQFYESAAVVDKDGNVLIDKDGSQNMVGFSKMECLMMKDNTLTHNHPGSSMFSTEDCVCFVKNNLQEIRATTREGTTYSLKRGEGYTEDKGHYFVRDYNGERIIGHRIAQKDLDQRGFREMIMDGKITQDQANKEFGRVVTNYMTEWTSSHASKYGIDFTVEKRKVENSYTVEEYTGKSAGSDDVVMVLDQETAELDAAAFNEWLNGKTVAKTFNEILDIEKFNPYHDRLGRFTSAGSETSFTYAPGRSNAHDKAIERHKERMAAAAPTEAQEKTLKGIESRTRNLKKEQFRVVDREGNVVMQKQGDKNSVSYSVGEARDNFPGNITIHNHPDGGTFSSADLSDIGYGATEIRAASPEGTYTLRNLNYRTKWTEDQKGWMDMRNDIDAASQDFKTHRQLKKELREPFEKQVKPLSDKWAKMRSEGASQEELNKIAKEYTEKWDALKPQLEQAARKAYVDQYHHWYNANAGKYGFEYTFTPKKETTRKSDTMEEFDDLEKGSGEIVLDRKMHEDVQEIVDDILSEYPRDLNQVDTRKSISIFKTDDDKRLVFGWASISMTVDGEPLEDRQQDIIDPEDLEEAVYEYVLNFRDTGEEHIKSLRKKGKLVESCVFTAEKQKAMGIPEGILPVGWWIGFKIEDDDAWERVKNGTYKMFSIEGKANRVPVEKAAPEQVIDKSDPDRFIRIEEFP